MNLSHGYGCGPERAGAVRLLPAATHAGYDHIDTAALGSNDDRKNFWARR